MADAAGITHICYEQGVPQEIRQAMAALYQSAFSVTEFFSLYKTTGDLNALVLYHGGSVPIHVFAYSLEGGEVMLLNELFDVEPRYLRYFADFIFDRYSAVHAVNLNRSKHKPDALPYPSRLWSRSQDTVIALPATLAEYQARLGSKTRSNFKYYSSRARKLYRDFAFTVATKDEVDPAVVSRIIELNRLRMTGKGIKSGFDSATISRIQEFSRRYGCTSTIEVNGEIVAGTIFYEVGNHCFLEAIAHDPRYNRDSMGQVCLYLTVKHAIEQGREAFHLLWGECEYKYRFLGVKQDLYSLSLYRSQRRKLLALPKLLKYRAVFFPKQLTYWMNKYVLNGNPLVVKMRSGRTSAAADQGSKR
jgi:hypothetical protein